MNKEEEKIQLGTKLKELRLARGYSQRELAALADTDYSQIYRIEKGQISPSAITIQILAEALGVTPCHFFDCK